MSITTRTLNYEIDGKTYEAVIAGSGDKRPAVLVAHAWAAMENFLSEIFD